MSVTAAKIAKTAVMRALALRAINAVEELAPVAAAKIAESAVMRALDYIVNHNIFLQKTCLA